MKICNIPDCTKTAQGNTNFCKGHGGGERCTIDGCDTSARYKTGFCTKHGGGKRCKTEECPNSAEGNSNFCITHGGGKRCIKEGCTKSARDKTEQCIEHGGGIRCPYCRDWPDSRGGNVYYDNYCITCFKHIFPSDPRSIKLRENSHESKVRNYLNEHMHGFIHDTPIYTTNCDCTHRRRIDHRILIGNTILAIETDEQQHIGYSTTDEIIRYDDLFMIHSGKWIFIRFNPDSYIKNGIKYNPDITLRLPILLTEIENQIKRIENDMNKEYIEIIKLYYAE